MKMYYIIIYNMRMDNEINYLIWVGLLNCKRKYPTIEKTVNPFKRQVKDIIFGRIMFMSYIGIWISITMIKLQALL